MSIRKNNIKKRGEVFTPPALVEEMVNLIPFNEIQYENTFLDPCNGATSIFPIFLMFKWCQKFGNKNVKDFTKVMYMVELNELAAEYGANIFITYCKMVEEMGVEFSKKHYTENWEKIIDDYYIYCENCEKII